MGFWRMLSQNPMKQGVWFPSKSTAQQLDRVRGRRYEGEADETEGISLVL